MIGAWADMPRVNGDPMQDITLLKDDERNFTVIIKDGKVYKNTIEQNASEASKGFVGESERRAQHLRARREGAPRGGRLEAG